jgi:translation initiation factor 3 subunit A
LVSDLSSKGVVNLVSDEVRQIYSLLEADFTPLELCQRLAPLLKQLESVTKTMSGVLGSKLQYRCLQR